jgi:hypothetical protein
MMNGHKPLCHSSFRQIPQLVPDFRETPRTVGIELCFLPACPEGEVWGWPICHGCAVRGRGFDSRPPPPNLCPTEGFGLCRPALVGRRRTGSCLSGADPVPGPLASEQLTALQPISFGG